METHFFKFLTQIFLVVTLWYSYYALQLDIENTNFIKLRKITEQWSLKFCRVMFHLFVYFMAFINRLELSKRYEITYFHQY